MNLQTTQYLEFAPGAARVLRLPRHGQLEVVEGRLWLTRAGDPDDHVLDAGARFRVDVANEVIVESWQPGQPARMLWRPSRGGLARFAGQALERLAAAAAAADRGLRSVADVFGALARAAAGSAQRVLG